MSALRALARRLGHQKWFAAVLRLLVPADRLLGRLTKGRVVALGLVPSLVLTTTGRRSGRLRSNPLLYVPDGDAYVVIGSNWGQQHQPAWSLNLLAQPAAEVDVEGRRIPVRAELINGDERELLFARLVAEWPAYRTYVERAGGREIRVFRLVPVSPPAPAT
ncbi:nitroreductase family deazaflavin-dependent oxidoreductase [Micromonospora sp. DR5-3]|uniref:nitroreductase family deazaflavin-dependent oxidoreductase n=1 Tax=unclassified Micromonospora TaxID=2617518 RepID=UPI0011D9683A|nr:MULTISPECIES: nitroreductase family deazaflavin-dependent oxidoreductase [unclassified Micromonospora]MCW3813454.1 nitroreductase family deazaflavin-dependent oxidoreductase [Micromonospora sp. DR5-3]TYC24877.1 nitroreductase family deazaflavin-dependent oxidoreductase [Micromonospora sp. MP36]